MPFFFVSVIIPVYNDAERLEKCLIALDKQTYPQELYEVIVVDNASDESIVEIVNKYQQASTICEAEPGSYAARNRGITVAKGKIFAFTDSDCIPAADWIEQGVKALINNPDCGIIGGKIKLFFRDRDRLTAVELYEDLTAFPQKRHIERNNFTPTANLFTYQEIFDEVGKFNQKLKSNGDREWCQLVCQQGYGIKYAEQAMVSHPARHSFTQIYRRYLRMAGGRADAYRAKYQQNLFRFKIIYEVALNLLSTPKDILVVAIKGNYSAVQRVKILLILLALKWGLNSEKMRVMLGGASHNY
ncbi:MAG: glycosyltransferase [Pleurocapsa sp.]